MGIKPPRASEEVTSMHPLTLPTIADNILDAKTSSKPTWVTSDGESDGAESAGAPLGAHQVQCDRPPKMAPFLEWTHGSGFFSDDSWDPALEEADTESDFEFIPAGSTPATEVSTPSSSTDSSDSDTGFGSCHSSSSLSL